ncbi:MAG: HAD-IB family hydrolase [Planctomycetes bacterium]|nr:HAD-IB family hydrolase [Planctomycetota bacterium]
MSAWNEQELELMAPAFAFFDVDGTLLRMRSMFAFEDYWLDRQQHNGDPDSRSRREQRLEVLAGLGQLPRELANRAFYRGFAGRDRRAVERGIRAWYRELRSSGTPYLRRETVRVLRALQRQGIEPVLVSGSFVELLRPFAEELGIRHILATRPVVRGHSYTGELDGPPMIGEGKRLAVVDFMARQGASPADCHACGDHVSDAAMLGSVGSAIVVAGDPALDELARVRGWQVVQAEVTR